MLTEQRQIQKDQGREGSEGGTEGSEGRREGREGREEREGREGGKGGREGRIRVVPEQSVIETKQCKATAPEDNSLFLRQDLNQQRSAYQADTLPTDPPRQLSWAGRIFKCYAKAKASLP